MFILLLSPFSIVFHVSGPAAADVVAVASEIGSEGKNRACGRRIAATGGAELLGRSEPGARMDSSGSCVPTATTWTEKVPESHANGSARPAWGARSLSSVSDIQTGYERFVHLAGRPGKRR
jgi:hypothetical protein